MVKKKQLQSMSNSNSNPSVPSWSPHAALAAGGTNIPNYKRWLDLVTATLLQKHFFLSCFVHPKSQKKNYNCESKPLKRGLQFSGFCSLHIPWLFSGFIRGRPPPGSPARRALRARKGALGRTGHGTQGRPSRVLDKNQLQGVHQSNQTTKRLKIVLENLQKVQSLLASAMQFPVVHHAHLEPVPLRAIGKTVVLSACFFSAPLCGGACQSPCPRKNREPPTFTRS